MSHNEFDLSALRLELCAIIAPIDTLYKVLHIIWIYPPTAFDFTVIFTH